MKYKFPLFIFSFIMLSVAAQAQLERITTIAGNGLIGNTGDGNSAVAASFFGPIGVAVDSVGNVYVEDFYNIRVRKINAYGIISTYAGNGIAGNSGDGSIASSAEIVPHGVAVDRKGDLYISDQDYGLIRKVNTLGIISTVAGKPVYGYSGDGGSALNAEFRHPAGIALDKAGNLYIADAGNNVVRKVSPAGIITTVAGNDTIGFSGDGGFAKNARLDSPIAVAVDGSGNLFITDYNNNVIRKVGTNDTITTFAGIPFDYDYTGDNGPATLAKLNHPNGIAVDLAGNLYIADADNNVIRKVDTSSLSIITTVAGNGTPGFGGDLGFATGANLYNPYGIAVDRFGSLYIADANNQRIRKVYNPTLRTNNVVSGTSLEIYPNPFISSITVSGLSKSDKVAVYDLVGRQVSDVWEVKTEGAQTFAISDLATGLYLLQVWDGNGNKKAVVKMVKE